MFTSKKSWSEAQMVCEMMGGYLASLDTAHKMSVVQHYLGQSLWKSATLYTVPVNAALTGLHNVDDLKADPYYWTRNCSRAAKPSYLYVSTIDGGCTSQTDSEFYSVACDLDQYIVCEVAGGSCLYETVVNKSAVSAVPFQRNVTGDVSACRFLCDAGGVGCWAVAFSPATGECRVYNVTSPFLFDDGSKLISDITFNLHIKRCYTALVNKAPISWVKYDAYPPASPCSSDQSGRVYTLVKSNRTAEHARNHCQEMGHELAGASVVDDRNVLQSIVSNMYQADYSVNQWYPLWVDFKGNRTGTGKPVWGNGSLVTTSVNVLGLNFTQCGLVDPERVTYYLDDCSRSHAFLCVTHRPCTYISKKEVMCRQNTLETAITTSETQCRSLCSQRRASGINCVAVSFKKFFFIINCYLHSADLPGLYPNMSYELGGVCDWWTCVYVVLQVEDLMPNITIQPAETGTTLKLTTDTTTAGSGLEDQTTDVQLTTTTPQTSQETTIKQTFGHPTTETTLTTTAQKTQETTPTSTGTSKQTGAETTTEQLTSQQAAETSTGHQFRLEMTSGQLTSQQTAETSTAHQFQLEMTSGQLTSQQTAETSTAHQFQLEITSGQLTSQQTAETSTAHQFQLEITSGQLTSQQTAETSTAHQFRLEMTSGQLTSQQTAETSTAHQFQTETTTGLSSQVTSSAPLTSEPANSIAPYSDPTSDVCVTNCDVSPTATAVHFTTTSSPSIDDVDKPRMMCSCRCNAAPPADAVETGAIVRALVVRRNATYRSRLRYISVDDNRTSSKSLGAVAIMFMCLVAVVIVLIDCSGGRK